MIRARVFVLLVALATAAGSIRPPLEAQASQSEAGYQNLSPHELQALLGQGRPFLLDVHVPNEGYLASTDARIPYTEVATRAAELPADPNTPIVVYCMTGRMSAIAAAELVRLGYTTIFNLAGGMLAWREAGYEVVPG